MNKLIGSETSDKLIIADLNENENEEEIKQALKPDNLNQLIAEKGIRGIVIFVDSLFLDRSLRIRDENFGLEILTKIRQFKDSNQSSKDFQRRVVLVGASNDYFSRMLTDYDYLKSELPFFIQNLLPKITKSFFDK